MAVGSNPTDNPQGSEGRLRVLGWNAQLFLRSPSSSTLQSPVSDFTLRVELYASLAHAHVALILPDPQH